MAYRLKAYTGEQVELALDKASAGYKATDGVVLEGITFKIDTVWLSNYITDLLKPSEPSDVLVQSIGLNNTSYTLSYGNTFNLTATITPANVTTRTVTWTSSDNSVATCASSTSTLDSSGKASVTIQPQKVASQKRATITARCGGKTASCEVTVEAYAQSPTSVTLAPTTLTLNPGGEQRLTASFTPSDANTGTAITWTTSNSNVATVNDGLVKANNNLSSTQSCTITATTANGKKATCSVTVSVAIIPTTRLTLNKSNLTLNPNETQTLTATRNVDANDNALILWKSSAPSVATVSNLGVVEGKTDGQCTITAYISGKEDSVYANCIVTVKTPVVQQDKILIGDITVGKEIGDELYGAGNGAFMTNAQNVSSILTDAIIQQNIDAGNLKEMNLEDVLSTYNDWIDRGEYIKLSFATTKSIPIPTRNTFTYHAILIPKSISDDYLPCWIDGVGAGCSFAFPWPDTYASIVDKTVSFNGETYSMSGYYVDMSGANGGYNLTIVKKNQ